MPASHQVALQLPKLGPHPLPHGPPHQEKPPASCLPADVREAEEVEGLRPALQAAFFSPLRCEQAKGDKPRLVGVQFQREASHSFAKLHEKPRGVRMILESNRKIVSVTHNDNVSPCIPLPPLLGPEIKDVVQVDIRKEWRDSATNRAENFGWKSRVARSALRARTLDGRKKRR